MESKNLDRINQICISPSKFKPINYSEKVKDFQNLFRFSKIKKNEFIKFNNFPKRKFKNEKNEAKKKFSDFFEKNNNFQKSLKEEYILLEKDSQSNFLFKLKKIRKIREIKKSNFKTPIKKKLVNMSLSEIFQRTDENTSKKEIPFINYEEKRNIQFSVQNIFKTNQNNQNNNKIIYKKEKIKRTKNKLKIKKNSYETNFTCDQKIELKKNISLKERKIIKFEEIKEKFNIKINLITPFFENLLKKQEFFNLNLLNKMEKKLIFYIICRKMKNCKKKEIFERNKKLSEMETLLRIYKNSTLEKRFEEVFKFGFKFFINNKIIIFKKKFPEKSLINSNFIYNYYFSDISKKLKIPILEFYDPTKKTQKKPLIKTFGKKYLKLILKSDIFKKDFLFFLKNDLKNFYYKELEKKIKNMFFQLFNKFDFFKEKNLGISTEDDLFEKNAYNYFVKNSQCKIPWSSVEIDYSVKKLESYILALMHL